MMWILHFQSTPQLDLWWPLILVHDLWLQEHTNSPILYHKPSLFRSNFQLFYEATFTFSAYLATWPWMTFDLDMWPFTSTTNEGFHIASMTQLCLKSMKACGSYSQMLTHFHCNRQTIADGKAIPVSFLLRQVTQKKTKQKLLVICLR